MLPSVRFKPEALLRAAAILSAVEGKRVEYGSPRNPLGIKGVGEAGCVPAAAAIVSAVEHALAPFGLRIEEYPMSPARLVGMIARMA